MAAGKRTERYGRSTQQSLESDLIPGISNDITLDLIAPKLPWRALRMLSSVSRRWKEAIRTRQVHEARVRAKTTETLFIHTHVHWDGDDAIALHSTSAKCWYELPPIPCFPRGELQHCQLIELDGKIYVLGGLDMRRWTSMGEVHVLDLAGGQWKWEQRANMLVPRSLFGCAVVDGKIYAFGGRSISETKILKSVLQSEVYDTQENAWSLILPMTRPLSKSFAGKYESAIAAVVGNEIFVYHNYASTVEVYNPAKNEWRSVERFWPTGYRSLVFIRKEKFYSLSNSGIDVYDDEQKSWISRHAHSFAALRPDYPAEVIPISILATEDELLLKLSCNIQGKRRLQSVECKGFDSERTEMAWERTNCSFSILNMNHFRFPIKL